ncbi:MAG: ABC transporter substrate-binding protein [Deltaproteobacteria bacterium]|nr:ABC transporter substrate-binding protein [Deltaproteobacteria bacterium]
MGLLEKYGLNAEVVMIPGSSRGIQALIGRSTQFAQGDGPAAMNARLQGADVVIIAGSLNKFPFSLVARQNIRQPSDLIGKKIGIVNFGGSNELAVVSALKEWSIPRQSITLLPSGGASSRLVALSTGALDATVLAPPETTKAKQMGLSLLADLSDLKARFPLNVIMARRDFVDKNRETVKRFLRAFSEGIHMLATDKNKALGVYARRLKLQDNALLSDTVNFFSGKLSDPPRVDRQGMENAVELISKNTTTGKVKNLMSEVLDETLINELEAEGFFRNLNRH